MNIFLCRVSECAARVSPRPFEECVILPLAKSVISPTINFPRGNNFNLYRPAPGARDQPRHGQRGRPIVIHDDSDESTLSVEYDSEGDSVDDVLVVDDSYDPSYSDDGDYVDSEEIDIV